MIMYGMYVHETNAEPYATQIITGKKTIETRTRDTLGKLCGQRVLVIRTRSGHKADIIGSVLITGKIWLTASDLYERRDKTRIPKGSKYDASSFGKWCYFLSDPIELEPIPLSDTTVIKRNMSFARISFIKGGAENDN